MRKFEDMLWDGTVDAMYQNIGKQPLTVKEFVNRIDSQKLNYLVNKRVINQHTADLLTLTMVAGRATFTTEEVREIELDRQFFKKVNYAGLNHYTTCGDWQRIMIDHINYLNNLMEYNYLKDYK